MTSMNSMRLRELIRSVRMCKTPTEERELINAECAWIRKEFKEGTPYVRTRNMLKLLYVQLLGYPTQFGQLEVMNLLSQSDFSGKRIGYLALQLILHENDEVLTLSENRMRSDMFSDDPLLQAVSLNAAANIAGEDMARDIFDEVITLVDSDNIYIRRKACLTALRIVRKAPEYSEYFLERFVDIFSNNRSGHLLCSLALINECLQTEIGVNFLPRYRNLVQEAVNILKRLVLCMRISERDVGDVADPFLQVKILEFMRIIGKDCAETSEKLNDILAHVITNTNSSRSAGCAVEYECIRTIDGIESSKDLRTLAVNRIADFLSSTRDNNRRFVALEMLLNYAKKDLDTVMRYQTTILQCLKDMDVSIRRKALELAVLLITDSNVRLLVPDLFSYLVFCAEEMREDVTLRISQIIEQKYPTDEWRIDMSIKLLKLSKQHAPRNFATNLICLISNQSEDVQSRVACVLWDQLSKAFDSKHQSHRAFLLVAIWVIGEYSQYILRRNLEVKVEGVTKILGDIGMASSDRQVKLYSVTALMKLAVRYAEPKSMVLDIFSPLIGSLDCELQQRAREYTIFLTEYPEEAAFSFARMPPIRFKKVLELSRTAEAPLSLSETRSKRITTDLDELFGFSLQKADFASTDLLKSGTSYSQGSAPEVPVIVQPTKIPGDCENLDFVQAMANHSAVVPMDFADNWTPPLQSRATLSSVVEQPAESSCPKYPVPFYSSSKEAKVYSCSNLSARLSTSNLCGHTIEAELVIQSHLDVSIEKLLLQVAVPKICTVRLKPLDSTTIKPQGELIQHVQIDFAEKTAVSPEVPLRVKLSYVLNGEACEHEFQI